jgi:hypothetical protein
MNSKARNENAPHARSTAPPKWEPISSLLSPQRHELMAAGP